MSDAGEAPGSDEKSAGAEAEQRRRLRAEAERRRRRAEVFGDVPVTTSDEREPAPGARESRAADRWWREQVPPHHG